MESFRGLIILVILDLDSCFCLWLDLNLVVGRAHEGTEKERKRKQESP